PGERVVVLTDPGRTVPLECEIIEAERTEGHGCEPHPDVWRAVFGCTAIGFLDTYGILEKILAKEVEEVDQELLERWKNESRTMVPDAVLAVTYYSTSHTFFRKVLNELGTRYASMPLFEEYLLREDGPLAVDREILVESGRKLLASLKGAVKIEVKSPNGTELVFSVSGRDFHSDDGDLTQPGSFGNLPAGEVYVAPVEGQTNGILVLEDGTRMEVEKGRCVKLTGDHPVKEIWKAHPEYFFIAELGMGTNPYASRPDNILEAEKIAGTIHVAFGDNAGFGGTQRIPYHEDHVVYKPQIRVDGRLLELPVSKPL
ncbi:MAG: peptidase, partial [Candidatus Hydrogenedentota bacterium]